MPDPKQWFLEKVAQEPLFLEKTYFPAYEAQVKKAEFELHSANRTGTLDEIKYRQGYLDGVQVTMNILTGIRLSESKQPFAGGLFSRMFGGNENA